MKMVMSFLLGIFLYASMTTFSFAEDKSGRFQIYSTNTIQSNDGVAVRMPIVFLLDTQTGQAWQYVGGVVKGTAVSLWSPVVPADKVTDDTKKMLSDATQVKMMEEAKMA